MVRLLVAAVVLLLVAAPAARADGDPAGDVLIQQNVFYGSKLDLRSKEAAQLMALTEQAKEKGYEIRVAALTVPEDLGAINYLWDDPTNYADFLTAEIQSVYRERTLVVMPSGLGIWWREHESRATSRRSWTSSAGRARTRRRSCRWRWTRSSSSPPRRTSS